MKEIENPSRRQVWKFEIHLCSEQTVLGLPEGAEVLTVGEQDGKIFLWAILDPEEPRTKRTFQFFGTGQPIPQGYTYQGTAHLKPFVWHVFEKDPTEKTSSPMEIQGSGRIENIVEHDAKGGDFDA